MRRLIKQVLRHPRLTAYLKSIYNEGKAEGLGGSGPETHLAEASPITCRLSSFSQLRLNLLVPALDIQHLFGGIATALSLFEALVAEVGLDHVRIILTDQQRFEHANNPAFADWDVRTLDQEDRPGRCIVAAGDRHARSLAVGPGDRFVATAWWTALSARAIQDWQAATCQLPQPAKYLYLIQDYEPGFYPWSSRYALAESTYHDAERFMALFNTSLLQRYFIQMGYRFPQAHAFEPVLHPSLRQQRKRLQGQAKERRLLVYGRPGVARNAFELTVMALRAWVARGGGAGWRFVSAGEAHPAIQLGPDCQLTALGKLSLEQYASELSRAAVGLSLMISPHPSYPPLEMAAFGLQVVSNSYGPKDLSELHPAILTVQPLTPAAIAEKLDLAAQRAFLEHQPDVIHGRAWQRYVDEDGGFDAVAAHLLRQWL
ncbi:MAG: hypothetical protein JXR59_07945 [Desulfuromonadaceae bacterium]|nr:hypothetical protein [Desulfuromonadaceae bacterium]